MIIYPFTSFGWYRQWEQSRNVRLVAKGTGEQITIEQARSHLRLDTYGSPPSHPDDAMITDVYLPIARAMCEVISGRSFIPQTYEAVFSGFPGYYQQQRLKLGVGPVRGIESVTYQEGGQTMTMDAAGYVLDPTDDSLVPAYGTTWPTVCAPSTMRVRFSAGYDVAGASPYEFIMPAQHLWAVYLALGHVYENRENTTSLNLTAIPMGINAMLLPDSLNNGFA